MVPWIKLRFGSLERVEDQVVVRIVNKYTLEGAMYNPLRASRPMEPSDPSRMEELISSGRQGDIFAKPLEGTPADTWGRIQGKYCMTASNVAKADAHHGLVIFNEFNPMALDKNQLREYVWAAQEWCRRAHAQDPSAVFPMIIWNCLWRAGSSVTHGHFQMLLGRGMPYGQVERLRQVTEWYRGEGGTNYFDALFQAHKAVGCAVQAGPVRAMVYLTPTKEREIMLTAPAVDDTLADAIYTVLELYRKQGVTSFNMSISQRPFAQDGRWWNDFPVVVRIVDRGDANAKVSDMGALELYAETVLATDPVQLGQDLEKAFRA